MHPDPLHLVTSSSTSVHTQCMSMKLLSCVLQHTHVCTYCTYVLEHKILSGAVFTMYGLKGHRNNHTHTRGGQSAL